MTKLYYTRSRGRAETTRWMLAVNQISFENTLIDTSEKLAALRATGKPVSYTHLRAHET